MESVALKALQYGVLGLCGVMLIATWRIIVTEQKRDGTPRKGILRFSGLFMAFCIILAGVNGYVQLAEGKQSRTAKERLPHIRSAATPLLHARVPTIESLPESPQKQQLLVFQRELLKALEEDGHKP